MQQTTLAIPSESLDGLLAVRSDHFGHSPAFTLVEVINQEVGKVSMVTNAPHSAGGCMKPVGLLAEQGVNALVVAGIGRGPFERLQQHGITVYFADSNRYPDVQSALQGFLNNELAVFTPDQLCASSGTCHHLPL